MDPIDQIRSDRSKGIRIDYPNGRTEIMWVNEKGILVGVMDEMGPWPLDEHDARVVVDRYDGEVVKREAIDA